MKKVIINLFESINTLSFFIYIYYILNYSEKLLSSNDGKIFLGLIVLGLINCILRIKQNGDNDENHYLLLGKR